MPELATVDTPGRAVVAIMPGGVTGKSHNHISGRHVRSYGDDVSTKPELGTLSRPIDCLDASVKDPKLAHKRVEEGVEVCGFPRSRYHAKTDDVLLLEPDLWGKIIVNQYERPNGMLSSSTEKVDPIKYCIGTPILYFRAASLRCGV